MRIDRIENLTHGYFQLKAIANSEVNSCLNLQYKEIKRESKSDCAFKEPFFSSALDPFSF